MKLVTHHQTNINQAKLHHSITLLHPVSLSLHMHQPTIPCLTCHCTCINLLQPASLSLRMHQPITACLTITVHASTYYGLSHYHCACINLLQPVSLSLSHYHYTCINLLQPVSLSLHMHQPIMACLTSIAHATIACLTAVTAHAPTYYTLSHYHYTCTNLLHPVSLSLHMHQPTCISL